MKKKKQEEPVLEEDVHEELATPKEYKHKAYSMYRDPKDQKHVVVEIGYDPESGDVGFIKELVRDVKEDAIDKLKINIADNVIVGDN